MNKWFSEVFLSSIFERCGKRREMWLTQKQTAVCTSNMEMRQTRYDADGYGTMHTHLWYECEWQGRRVSLSYSKKNGCGYISFEMNAEEQAEHLAKIEAEKQKAEAERIARIKADPERLAKRISFYAMKIETAKANLQAALEEGDQDDAEWYGEKVAEYEAKLAKYTA